MQNPKNNQQSTIKSILVGIAVMIIGTIAIYFLKFFGLSVRAILIKSISQASNSELYANIVLISVICLLGLIAFIVPLLIWRKKRNQSRNR
jgi:ABC-type Fe3+-siderophore transport system permease subunit